MAAAYAPPVLLVVDVGNTQTHFGTFDGDELVEHWRFATVRTSTSGELGADRLVNAVAAFEDFGGPVVVIDFGTAITFDIASADGEYVGGIIAPGIEISMEALTLRAAALPKIDLFEPRSLIGKGTVDAIRSGVIFGFASMVDGVVGRLREELGDSAHTIATGGLAEVIVPYCRSIETIDDMLTLKGLKL